MRGGSGYSSRIPGSDGLYLNEFDTHAFHFRNASTQKPATAPHTVAPLNLRNCSPDVTACLLVLPPPILSFTFGTSSRLPVSTCSSSRRTWLRGTERAVPPAALP